MKWDYWYHRSQPVEKAFLLNKHLLAIPFRGSLVRVNLNKIARADEVRHTHPSAAIRIILWGGYVEEVTHPDGSKEEVVWFPGCVGVVGPDMIHRIVRLLTGGPSYSIWLRGPVTRNIKYWVGEDEKMIPVVDHPRRKTGLAK